MSMLFRPVHIPSHIHLRVLPRRSSQDRRSELCKVSGRISTPELLQKSRLENKNHPKETLWPRNFFCQGYRRFTRDFSLSIAFRLSLKRTMRLDILETDLAIRINLSISLETILRSLTRRQCISLYHSKGYMIISDWAHVGAHARKSKSHTGSPNV